MDPKLSELQYRILTVGARRRALGRQHGRGGCPDGWLGMVDVAPADLKMIYYGFVGRRQGKLQFDVATIGESRYRAAGVAITKSFSRLCDRGLAERRAGGVLLSTAGLALAAELLTPGEAAWLDARLT